MSTDLNAPSALLATCWDMINQGIQSRKHNYHTMGLHYITNGKPRSVNVIPRKLCLETHLIHVHTDQRSQKVAHLSQQSSVCCLFWCREQKVQVILEGKASLRNNDPLTESTWNHMSTMSKICYCADIPPNSPSEKRTSGFTEEGWKNRHQIAQTRIPYQNFTIIQILITSLERLHLSANGHDRIKFTRNLDSNLWTHQWLAP